ncbi:MAG TPA: penicillin-binding protein 2 [Thermomicrobiales bacterium]|nr:penicillin-binding protein 2 [Thermomicrobiales bacterium]
MTELPRQRVYCVLLVFALFLGSIGTRLVSFQVFRGAALSREADAEHALDEPVPARRGVIYDSTGQVLATTIPAYRVFAIVDQVTDPDALAQALAAPLAMSPDAIAKLIKDGQDKHLDWVQLQRHLTPTASDQVRALNLKGIVLDSEPQRVYPNGDFASAVLGFANWDMQGSYGVEGYYNAAIGGKPGHLIAERDVHGNIISVAQNRYDPPVDGDDAVLTINAGLQRQAEQELDAAVKDQNAAGGTVIVMDVQTGAILAMASRPSFDPNNFAQYDLSTFNNPAISEIYEPGSTFKLLTMAIGIDTGKVTPDTVHDDAPGYILVQDGNQTFRITNSGGAVYGRETMTQVLERSANLGAAFVAQRVGPELFYAKLREFGIGQPTGVDLQGEEAGIVHWDDAPDWRPVNLITNSFGQGIAVTPLQMITAISAIVNGGKLMRPYIVKELRHNGQVVKRNDPQVVRQVISPQTSRQVVDMMTDVVDKVSYPYIGVPGYAIGSKSGTAQVPAPNGGYLGDDVTIGSEVGIGPSENPRFAVLVVIDRPKKDPWGAHVAGPPVRDLLIDLFTEYAIPPTRREP